jgi:ribosomal protein L11 methyltransferase
MCLELLEEFARPSMKVLDVGCGSGILSIAAAKLGAETVVGLEIDSVAVQAAVSNVGANNVAGTVRVMHGTLDRSDLFAGAYDLALANISAKVLSELAESLVAAVRPGGKIIASGVLTEKREAIEQRIRDAGAAVERTVIDGDWVTLVAEKNSRT